MKNLKFFILTTFVLLLNSCSVLTKSQIKNINAFAATAEKYAIFPGEVPRQRASLFLEERLVQTILFSNADNIKLNINKAIDNYDALLQSADKFDLSLLLIQQYASLLSKLSSKDFVGSLNTNTNNLNDNLGSLVKIANLKLTNKIPITVSDAITKVIFLVGQKLTIGRQAKALKEFIPQGQILITITMQNIEEALVSMKDLLAQDKTKYINTYTAIIFNDAGKMNYVNIRQYVTALNNFENIEQLRVQSISAARKLSIAHTKLQERILVKDDLMEIYSETQDFILSLHDLYKTYEKLITVKK